MTTVTSSFASPEQQRMARIGRKVRERLAAVPEAYKVPTDKAEIYAIGNFMSGEECGRMIAMIDQVAKPSEAFDVAYSTGYRTSYSGDPDPYDPFVQRIERRIDDLLGMEPRCGETVQGQRYQVGQQFQAHTDWFPPNTPYWETEKENGGQRVYTAMAYLNDVQEGGATHFTQLGVSIAPKPGVLLVWNNTDTNGVPNPWTVHAGTPVVQGEKYIITKWYRARHWR